MASMDLDAVLQDLNRRFAAPLPEFYNRRIIFWYDTEREFEDQLDDIQLENATLVVLTGSNTFAVKKLLCIEDLTSNFLVYQPQTFVSDDENWLINVQLYSEAFRADLNSIWMDEMGLPQTQAYRTTVKDYRKFFNAKSRREAVARLSGSIKKAGHLRMAVLSVLCGCREISPDRIIRAVLSGGLEMETNETYQKLVTYGAQNDFWILAARVTGYSEGEDADLGHLAVHLLLTAATRTMHPDHFVGLESWISDPNQASCYDFVSDWMHSEDNSKLYDIACFVEEEMRLSARLEQLTLTDLMQTECFPCIHECILINLMTEIRNQIISVEEIKEAVEKRRTMAWYAPVSCYYEGLLQIANMQQFYLEHSGGFHTVEPQKVWQEYTTDYYQMDTYYRQFHLCFQRCLKVSNPLLDDLFKHVAEAVEGLYSHWFLGKLGQNWSDACADSLAQYGSIREVPQQTDFYRSKVRYAESRVFVIVSDALRYELAASLTDQLRRETQSTIKLSSCEAMFPTITKFGMAALLPHQKLEVVEKTPGKLSILADGVSTDANYRDSILKNTKKNSVALKYNAIIGMKRAERSALVKGMDVVYIYHDKVDEASHISDTSVFPACEEAIAELKNLVRIIVNEFGGTRIYITADHGFLYTYSPLSEDDKLDKSGFASRVVEYGRRYAVMKKESRPDYLLPVKFMEGRSDYDAFAPRENVRIRMKGGGLNFVHGGISLQEMVVPIIEYQHLRSSSKTYQRNRDKIDTKPVALNLISTGRKVHNMIFSLNFLQTEAVGGNRESAVYLLYFVDAGGNLVSDTNKIIADRSSENAQERTFRCNFHLRSQEYSNRDSYYLVIADENNLQPPQKEEFQIDIAFAVDSFDFF